MSSNAEDQCNHSARATAPSSAVSKVEQTSPTAGEPAVSSRMKSVSPTSTKKAWRQRMEVDAALAAVSAALATVPSSTGQEPTADGSGAGAAGHLHQSQLFVCRHCGKYFITLKYLEMHSALHAVQLTSAAVHPQPTLSSPSPVHSQPQPITPRPSSVVDRSSLLSQRTSLPSATSLLKGSLPVLLPPSTSTTSAPPRYRNWTCDICRKKFSQNSSYKNHQRTHSDERPFVCTICSIGFKERYHLKKHMLFKHSNETREQCRVCGKRFKGWSQRSLPQFLNLTLVKKFRDIIVYKSETQGNGQGKRRTLSP